MFERPSNQAIANSINKAYKKIENWGMNSGTIAVNEIVKVINGTYVSKDADYEKNDTFFSYTRGSTTTQTPLNIRAIALDSTRVFVTYQADLATDTLYGIILTFNTTTNTFTAGSETSIASIFTRDMDINLLDTNKVVITYSAVTTQVGYAVICTIATSTITVGTPAIFNNAITYESYVEALSTTKFIVTYKDGGNLDYGAASIGDVSGTTITFGSEYVFKSAQTENVKPRKISSTSALITFNSTNAKAIIASVSGTVITFGTEVNIKTGSTCSGIDSCIVSSTEAVVLYNYGSYTTGAMRITMSGTTITVGTDTTISELGTSQYNNRNINMFLYDSTKIIAFLSNKALAINIVAGTLQFSKVWTISQDTGGLSAKLSNLIYAGISSYSNDISANVVSFIPNQNISYGVSKTAESSLYGYSYKYVPIEPIKLV